MASGAAALFWLLISVVLIITLTGRYKVNAFIVLIGVSFGYGLAVGMSALEVVRSIKNGFGGILTSIGIVIVAGTILGTILEKTGAALAMTDAILRLVGKKRAPLAMNIAGYVVSIPVFCDSGYIILNPLNKALARESGTSMTVMAVALATGLYATHTLVPPTPGPIAAAGALGADLGKVILLGLLAAVPASLGGLLWASKVARKYGPEADVQDSCSGIVRKSGKLPGGFLSFLPLLMPIVFILLKSVAEFPSKPFGGGKLQQFISFMGDPVTALMFGVALSLLLVRKGEMKEALDGWMGKGIRDSAIILVITAAGGSFGQVIKGGPLVDFIKTNLGGLNLGIFLPFLISAALKTAQGSSTVAIVTTSSIMAPILPALGLDPALTVIAIGAGSMVVSHANDSYFWVVSQFSNMPVATAYKAFTTATAVEGFIAFAAVFVMSFFVR